MKKTINILLVMLITFLLSSCVTSQTDVNQAKHELWIIELEEDTIDSWTNIDMEIEKAKDEISKDGKMHIQTELGIMGAKEEIVLVSNKIKGILNVKKNI